jgi:hypothetical protein
MIRIRIESIFPRQTQFYQRGMKRLQNYRDRLRQTRKQPSLFERAAAITLAKTLGVLNQWDDRLFAKNIRRRCYPLWKNLLDRGPYLGFTHDIGGLPAFTKDKEVADREFWRSAAQYNDTTHPDYDPKAAAMAQYKKIKAGLDWKVYVQGPLYPVKPEVAENICPLHPAGCPAQEK